MAAVAHWLADTSALSRLSQPVVAEVVGPRIEAGTVGMCGMVALELLYSARSDAEYARTRDNLRVGFEWLPIGDEEWERAIEVQAALSTRGRLREVKPPDLLIAATAERHQVTVVHYDSDYDAIAEITDQPTQWVVPRGSVPQTGRELSGRVSTTHRPLYGFGNRSVASHQVPLPADGALNT